MTGLKQRLLERIRRDGPISLADYMALCLTDPQDGYYTRKPAIGAEGDFITAPEISQVFGELLGLAFADTWQRGGAPAAVHLVELGPGRGTLMADFLRAARMVPGFFASLEVHLVEISPRLAAEQARSLAASGKQPRWHERLDTLPTGIPLYLIANEFFDALPVRQFERLDLGWRERRVGADASGALTITHGEIPIPVAACHSTAPIGAIIETCAPGQEIAGEIAARIAGDGGLAMLIDYGHGGRAVGDTFQAVRGHRYTDPLAEPGQADLTAHVDFLALAQAAHSKGAHGWGPIPQGSLLGQLGLFRRIEALAVGKPPGKVREITAAANRLAAPDQMGSLFQCLALTPPGAPVPAGFDTPATLALAR